MQVLAQSVVQVRRELFFMMCRAGRGKGQIVVEQCSKVEGRALQQCGLFLGDT